MPFKAIFFDAAGTLIHLAESVGDTYSRFSARFGINISAEAINTAFRTTWLRTPTPHRPEGQPAADDDRSWWQQIASQTFERALGHAVASALMEPLFDELYAHYADPAAWKVFADVRPALDKLNVNHQLLILSNFDRRLRRILEGHELLDYFTHLFISSEIGAYKPHARMFEAALRASNAQPENCLHVGDDARCDVEGAQLAGLSFFEVKRPECGLDMLPRLISIKASERAE